MDLSSFGKKGHTVDVARVSYDLFLEGDFPFTHRAFNADWDCVLERSYLERPAGILRRSRWKTNLIFSQAASGLRSLSHLVSLATKCLCPAFREP